MKKIIKKLFSKPELIKFDPIIYDKGLKILEKVEILYESKLTPEGLAIVNENYEPLKQIVDFCYRMIHAENINEKFENDVIKAYSIYYDDIIDSIDSELSKVNDYISIFKDCNFTKQYHPLVPTLIITEYDNKPPRIIATFKENPNKNPNDTN